MGKLLSACSSSVILPSHAAENQADDRQLGKKIGLGVMPSISLLSWEILALMCCLFCLPFLPLPAPANATAHLREVHGLHALPVLPDEGYGVPGVSALRVGAPG